MAGPHDHTHDRTGRDRWVRTGTHKIGRSGKARRFRHPSPFLDAFRARAYEEAERLEREQEEGSE